MKTTLSASTTSAGVTSPTHDLAIRRIYTALTFTICTAWLIAISPQFLNDPDTLWHIRTGRDIWENGRLPFTDAYSHSYFGAPWIAKEWLAQLLLFAAYAIGGWNVVTGLTVLCIAVSGALLFHYLSLRLSPSLAIVLVLVAIFASSQTYLARPHVLAFPILVIWTEHVMRASERDRAPSYVLLPLMIVWANLNASFLIGLVIAGFGFLNFLQRTRDPFAPAARGWLLFLTASLVATVIHPYGIRPLITAITVFGGKDWLKGGEWRPIDAVTEPIHEALLLVLLAVVLVAGLRLRAAKAAFCIVLLHLFLSHVRFAYLFYFLVPLACSYEIMQQKPGLSARPERPRYDSGIFAAAARHSRPVIAGLSLLPVALITHMLLVASHSPPSSISPAGALSFARSTKISGNVLNSGEFGGYLIFKGLKSFVDGRGDQLFDNAFLREFSTATQPGGDAAFQQLLDRYKITWTLIKPSDPVLPALLDRQSNFRRVYQDQDAIIHVRTTSLPGSP